ncbi:MAG: hypothetical protein KatS3mg087_0312 [Patescibacteria group bacterium]|nr:MAG: hypothetical protein KatS3mg087_0312 [Patescibacteria group bacterium]
MAKHENCRVPNCPVCGGPKILGGEGSARPSVRATRTTSTSTHSGIPGEAYDRIFGKIPKEQKPEEPLIDIRPTRPPRRTR